MPQGFASFCQNEHWYAKVYGTISSSIYVLMKTLSEPPPYTLKEERADENDKHPATVSPSPVSPNAPVAPLACTNDGLLRGYFFPDHCSVLKLGTVFVDWNSPADVVYRDLEGRCALSKGRDSTQDSCSFERQNNFNVPGKLLSLIRSSHDIRRSSYQVENLSITECHVDEKLEEILAEKQEIRNIKNSPEKRAFFVYGTARGEKVKISEAQSSNSGLFLGRFNRFRQAERQTMTKSEDLVFGVAVLRLRVKGGALRVEPFTKGAHSPTGK